MRRARTATLVTTDLSAAKYSAVSPMERELKVRLRPSGRWPSSTSFTWQRQPLQSGEEREGEGADIASCGTQALLLCPLAQSRFTRTCSWGSGNSPGTAECAAFACMGQGDEEAPKLSGTYVAQVVLHQGRRIPPYPWSRYEKDRRGGEVFMRDWGVRDLKIEGVEDAR